jgi:hypothetical protein
MMYFYRCQRGEAYLSGATNPLTPFESFVPFVVKKEHNLPCPVGSVNRTGVFICVLERSGNPVINGVVVKRTCPPVLWRRSRCRGPAQGKSCLKNISKYNGRYFHTIMLLLYNMEAKKYDNVTGSRRPYIFDDTQ